MNHPPLMRYEVIFCPHIPDTMTITKNWPTPERMNVNVIREGLESGEASRRKSSQRRPVTL